MRKHKAASLNAEALRRAIGLRPGETITFDATGPEVVIRRGGGQPNDFAEEVLRDQVGFDAVADRFRLRPDSPLRQIPGIVTRVRQ